MTKDEAFLAMYAFLDGQLKLGVTELGELLGAMSLLPDGKPVDPALMSDWNEAIVLARSGAVDVGLNLRGKE